MRPADFEKLREDAEAEILAGRGRVGILGLTSVTLDLVRSLDMAGLAPSVEAVYVEKDLPAVSLRVPVRTLDALADDRLSALVVAADDEKEELLDAALPHISGTPRVIVAGYGHLQYREREFGELQADLLVPSIANGYPNCLVHIYQCLLNAARLDLSGAVSEFGTFKGGTAVFIAKTKQRLRADWHIYSFDTFDGFPPRRSPLDMYQHPGAEFKDVRAVRNYADMYGVELIEGDIVDTANKVAGVPHVLAFIDTDNYSSGKAALDAVKDSVVVGGAIIFDHLTGVDRFRYTLGERFAARTLLDDSRYFNLHGTGVFVRQR